MAMIRSESAALERYAPGAMPEGLDVIDAEYEVLPDIGIVDRGTGEIIEPKPVQIESKPEPVRPEMVESSHRDVVDRTWVIESIRELDWRTVIPDYLKQHCWLVDTEKIKSVGGYLDNMTEKEQRDFEAEIQRRLKKAGK
jgi:hypothetical protein